MSRSTEHPNKFSGGDIERDLIQNAAAISQDCHVLGRNCSRTLRVNQAQRVPGKLKDVTGNPHTVAENETLACERDAVQLGPEPTAIGQKIIVALAFDHGVNA